MRMTGRIYLLFAVTAFVLGVALLGYAGAREYQKAYDETLSVARAQVLSLPQLQIEVYNRDVSGLRDVLQSFLEQDPVTLAVAYSSQGSLLARLAERDADYNDLPSLASVRTQVGAAATLVNSFAHNGAALGTGLWSSLTNTYAPLHFTAPVLSVVNPAQRGLTEQDFATALLNTQENKSLVVMGYVHLLIDRSVLLSQAMPGVIALISGYFVLITLCATAIFFALRRVTSPLGELSRLAREVAAGEHNQHVAIPGGEEFSEIVGLYNRLIDGVQFYQQEIEVDRKLLNMKVDESASILSEKEEQLNKAEEEITQTRDQLHKLAYYDSLTSLPNRALFTEQLRMLLAMSERDCRPLALLIVNLKHFKRINDSLGRRAGDALLAEVGKRLTGCLRSSDMLGHYSGKGPKIDVSHLGGDEFTIVLNQLDNVSSAGLVAQRLIDTLREPVSIEEHELVIAPSIGIAVAPDDGAEVEGLLRAAGTAMHQAKEAPTGGFVFYKSDMDAGGLDHIKLETELRKAVELDQLRLHYQPQVDTVDGSILGAEALLRWEHPEYGLVPPFRFLPIAEEIGLMDELGCWVLEEACRQLQVFRNEGLEFPRVAINVSRLQFGDRFTNRVREVLEKTGIPPSALELGLSEDILIDNDSDTISSLRALSAIGVHLAIDNFGTTHAPLRYLSQYPLNEVKIDRSFVADCDTQESSASLVRAIIAMAKSLNLSIVAEGVETQGEYQFLSDAGARTMQGYLFSKPVPAEELREQLIVPWHYMTLIQRMVMTHQQAQKTIVQSGGTELQ